MIKSYRSSHSLTFNNNIDIINKSLLTKSKKCLPTYNLSKTNHTDMFWVVPPPSNSGKWRFRLGFPTKNAINNPGGDWNPGRGDNPRYVPRHHVLIILATLWSQPTIVKHCIHLMPTGANGVFNHVERVFKRRKQDKECIIYKYIRGHVMTCLENNMEHCNPIKMNSILLDILTLKLMESWMSKSQINFRQIPKWHFSFMLEVPGINHI